MNDTPLPYDFTPEDELHMRHALGLAELGLNTTDPNPRVGCVIARGAQVLGEGWHERAGGPHAEVRALQDAGPAARGATAFVTLEPCASQGRTPPCVGALLAAGIGRVVFAGPDPNPRMVGGGEALRVAGVLVQSGLLAADAQALNPGFYKRHATGLPWVRAKLGMSLDGRIALATGESRWITSPEARADAQKWRARSSAILTGIGTVLADDPAMNVRIEGASRQPRRVLLDSALRVPLGARMLAREGEVLVLTAAGDVPARAALQGHGAAVHSLPPAPGGGLELRGVLAYLASLDVNEVWVEAGARLTGAFLAAGLVDELVLYVAPTLLGVQAQPLAQLSSPARLADRLQFEYRSTVRIGTDLRIIAAPRAPTAQPVAHPGGRTAGQGG
jgi:diaminohydroxyphosphoribosylaminopyrimidine deaminase/5-amino-6-(5-phosphoribosylamino)uracil reductase